jgi:hypothetical protein
MSEPISRIPRQYPLLCLLIAAWFVPSSAAVAAEPADNLQQLVNDTGVQIQLAYRQLPNERDRRQAELDAVVNAWRASNRSEASDEQLATWLHAAIRNSMPGSTKPLPPVPTFAAVAKREHESHVERSVVQKAPTVSDVPPDADPFRDDPASAHN